MFTQFIECSNEFSLKEYLNQEHLVKETNISPHNQADTGKGQKIILSHLLGPRIHGIWGIG